MSSGAYRMLNVRPLRGGPLFIGSKARVLNWVLSLGPCFSNYSLNFKREIITFFLHHDMTAYK